MEGIPIQEEELVLRVLSTWNGGVILYIDSIIFALYFLAIKRVMQK